MTLDEARQNIGRGVVYTPGHGWPVEQGTITGCSDTSVFVLYLGDMAPKGTRPEDLVFLAGSA